MDAVVRHYKLNIYLLSSIGLWPYASKKIRHIQNILVSTLIWFGLLIQLGIFGTFKQTVDLFLKNVSFVLTIFCFLFKYNCMWFQIGTVKHLMELVKYDWDSLKVEEELGIIKEHARMGTYYTRLFALLIYPSVFAFILSPFVSDFLNVVVPLNESKRHQFLITTGTILDEDKYFYVLASAMTIVILAGVTTVIATEGIFFVWLQHAAAMFEIVRVPPLLQLCIITIIIYSYRLRGIVISDSINKDPSNSKSEARTFANIVDAHRRAIKFFNYLKRKFCPSYLVLCGLGVTALSIHLFRLSRLVESLNEIGELLFSCSIVISALIYLYYLHYLAAQAIDFSNDIYRESYNVRWYETPVATQKMLIIIMLGNVKSVSFDFYGFYNCSIEGFGKLVRLSVSYFMVLRSMA